MNDEDFLVLKKAIETIQMNPNIKRLDGTKWSVYIVGTIIRVDIKQ